MIQKVANLFETKVRTNYYLNYGVVLGNNLFRDFSMVLV